MLALTKNAPAVAPPNPDLALRRPDQRRAVRNLVRHYRRNRRQVAAIPFLVFHQCDALMMPMLVGAFTI